MSDSNAEFERLHPALQYHVVNTLGWRTLRPTQLAAIQPIQEGLHCLLLAPTAGGKTEAAAIPILSRMLTQSWGATSVLYICPIKALINNLEPRLAHYAGLVGRRVGVWHGDISQSSKTRALRDAPDVLLTTPESLEAMLISTRIERAAWFGNLRAVIVDELHALASDDRGWHLRSVLRRLERYAPAPLQRLGLSATVSNPQELLDWLAPTGHRQVVGSASVSTDADVTIDHVGSMSNAATVISRLYRGEKRLVFCDSRSGAEQLSSTLREHGVRTFVSHASLSLSERRQAEAAFAQEKDCVIVATSTLELGIDVGDLDRVIQIDSPATVSSFLQRMGRTGRRQGSRRNCLFLTTSEAALLQALGVTTKWAERWVEAAMPAAYPWHIAAQQALVLCLELGQAPTDEVVSMLGESFPELDPGGITELVRFLVSEGFLAEDAAVVHVGPRTEAEFGRGNYLELLASFTGSQLLTGRHGAAEVGYIDPTALSADKGERLLLLAGRSWKVQDVDWRKRVVWLEPAASGGRARWMGGARNIGRDVCLGIRTSLIRGAPEVVTMSRRARDAFHSLAEALPVGVELERASDLRIGLGGDTWTYAGTKANRTLARLVAQGAHGGSKVRFDALTVQAPVSSVPEQLPSSLALARSDVDELRIAIKFADCVPERLLAQTLVARCFEVAVDASRSAREALVDS